MSDQHASVHAPGEVDPMRVLLWYRRGAGLHFSGPGRTAYRMYAAAESDRFRVTLVHGYPGHAEYDLFDRQICLGNCGTSLPSQVAFIIRGKHWLASHAS